MVWAQTTKVGCGFVMYGKNEQLLACNYSPTGNFLGQKIYERGPACSKCPANMKKCDDGLCSAA
jgi:hypothetical protein